MNSGRQGDHLWRGSQERQDREVKTLHPRHPERRVPQRAFPGIPPGAPRRALDLAVAGVGLLVVVLLSPLIVAIVIVIRLSSPGPIFYRQTRVGQGGRHFTMYKFRSMTTDSGPEVTASSDPRITRVGRVLRKTKVDELPQLFNLLRGDMTLVGPRPETPRLAARYEPDQAVVFRYRPGVTGLVQIYMPDSDVLPADLGDPEDYYIKQLVPVRVAIDLEYLSHPTLLMTLEILVKTALFLFRGPRQPAAPRVVGS
jgi:lipopolysaccharide/colanic/teichoic acid biosynthesis glycosyltransferase